MSDSAPHGGTGHRGAASEGLRVVAEIMLASVGLGLAVGVLWWLVAPAVTVGIRGEQPVLVAAEARNLFGVDASFGVVGAAAGLLLGAVMSTRHRRYPTAVLAGLVLGGVVGSLLAWQVGHVLGPDPLGERTDGTADGATLAIPLDLEAMGVLLFWPIMAVVTTLVLGMLGPRLPARHRTRGESVSPGERSEPW